jgi:homoserine O-acetyltransferase
MKLVAWWLAGSMSVATALAADYPAPVERDAVLKEFKFRSGETLPEVKIHYRAFGQPRRDAQGVVRNAVLVMHGTGGNGTSLVSPMFAGELFGAGQPLDATKYYIIVRDALGHGGSTKPSDGLHARFPRYSYLDMVDADHRMLTEVLGVNHLRLVMGTSMGGMHTWVWGERYPDFMDALLPLASVPGPIAGRNRAWRRVVIDAIRRDPQWRGGDYTAQPPGLWTAAQMLFLVSQNSVIRQNDAPTLAKADEVLDTYVTTYLKTGDANDLLYAVEASRDYDPAPALDKIKAPLLAINFADDLINPPELGILEREIKRVPRGRAVVQPLSADSHGHQSHTYAKLWKDELVKLLAETER